MLAVASDVGLSFLRGWIFRSEAFLLLSVDAWMVATIAVPIALVLSIAGKGRLSVAIPFAGAWAAVALPRFRHLVHDPATLLPEALLLVAVAGIGYAEIRRGRPFLALLTAGACVAAAAGTVAAIALPLPGREMLAPAPAASGEAATVDRPNVLVVVLDTVRADHLGLYGYSRETSPHLDRFASDATVFDRAVAATNWTLPSHATLFTGLYPRSHGTDTVFDDPRAGIDVSRIPRIRDPFRVRRLPEAAVTLAELAKGAEWDTGAICGNVTYLYRVFGLDQGFDTYVDAKGNPREGSPVGFRLADALGVWRFWPYRRALYRNGQSDRTAEEVNRLAVEWLAPRRNHRFFLFVNYMDAHDPYLPEWRDARRFPAASRPIEIDRDAVQSRSREILPEERAPAVDAYDAEIRYLDRYLGELFERLRTWDLLEKTVVVVVGDHGESFGEHGNLAHGNDVVEPEVHVPLVVRMPGRPGGERIARRVTHADVMPTLLHAMAVPEPPGLEGTDLFATDREIPIVTVSDPKPGLAVRYSRYGRSHEATYRGEWKLVRHSDGEIALYDLDRDPGEATDRSRERPDVVAPLVGELDRFHSLVHPRFTRAVEPIDEEGERRLRSLGYIP